MRKNSEGLPDKQGECHRYSLILSNFPPPSARPRPLRAVLISPLGLLKNRWGMFGATLRHAVEGLIGFGGAHASYSHTHGSLTPPPQPPLNPPHLFTLFFSHSIL